MIGVLVVDRRDGAARWTVVDGGAPVLGVGAGLPWRDGGLVATDVELTWNYQESDAELEQALLDLVDSEPPWLEIAGNRYRLESRHPVVLGGAGRCRVVIAEIGPVVAGVVRRRRAQATTLLYPAPDVVIERAGTTLDGPTQLADGDVLEVRSRFGTCRVAYRDPEEHLDRLLLEAAGARENRREPGRATLWLGSDRAGFLSWWEAALAASSLVVLCAYATVWWWRW
jgi:hypothetical protein